jgi:hypothetical protein
MREVTIGEKMRAGSGRIIRAMIRGTMQAYERKVPAAVAHAQHIELMLAAAACQDTQLEAAKAKAERLDAHYKRQKRRQGKRQANRLRKEAKERVAMMEATAKRVRGIAGS